MITLLASKANKPASASKWQSKISRKTWVSCLWIASKTVAIYDYENEE